MPRTYRLGRREAPKAETRARIVDAAIAIYRDRGVAAASTLAIAREADVAPATVRNHFPGPDDLTDAVIRAIIEQLRVPTPAIFEGLDAIPDRLRRLAVELAAFYERGESWWQIYQREPELIRAWGGGIDDYYAGVEGLMRAALGDLGDDERAVAVVASVIGPPTFFALRARGLGADDAVELGLELVVPWLERRRPNPRRPKGQPAT